mmetsp:Transcript_9037/g.19158  ORF Transcript_9037/g.19158 Transcript_9037/m.19158 type:complete len:155 (+) Transcript_9037:382-846(+)
MSMYFWGMIFAPNLREICIHSRAPGFLLGTLTGGLGGATPEPGPVERELVVGLDELKLEATAGITAVVTVEISDMVGCPCTDVVAVTATGGKAIGFGAGTIPGDRLGCGGFGGNAVVGMVVSGGVWKGFTGEAISFVAIAFWTTFSDFEAVYAG